MKSSQQLETYRYLLMRELWTIYWNWTNWCYIDKNTVRKSCNNCSKTSWKTNPCILPKTTKASFATNANPIYSIRISSKPSKWCYLEGKRSTTTTKRVLNWNWLLSQMKISRPKTILDPFMKESWKSSVMSRNPLLI